MVAIVSRSGIHRLHEPAHVFEVARRELPQGVEVVGGEEFGRESALHIGGHRLHRLLADFGELPGLVGHSAMLPAHAQRTGLAGIFGSHRPQKLDDPAGLSGGAQRIPDRRPAPAA